MKTIDLISMRHFVDENTIEKLLYKQPGQNYTLFGMGDVHIGNIGKDDKETDRFKRRVKSVKNAYIINMGDNMESINVTDKRYSVLVHGSNASVLQNQRDDFISEFNPIGDRFLNIMDGNHEAKFKNDFKPNKDIAKEFGCPYSEWGSVKFIFPKFRIHAEHGYGSINSNSLDARRKEFIEQQALKNILAKIKINKDCDIAMMGHTHKLILVPPNSELYGITDSTTMKLTQKYNEPGKIDMGNGNYRIHNDDRYYINTGSFLKSYIEGHSSYPEERGMSMAELGWVEIEVKNGKPSTIVLNKSK